MENGLITGLKDKTAFAFLGDLLDNNPFIILFNWCAVHFYDIL